MVSPVKTHSAHSAGLESKKLSNRGENLFLDFPFIEPANKDHLKTQYRETGTLTATKGFVPFVDMSNALSEEKRQQVIALGRLGWPLRRIEQETGVRRETASAYLKSAGIGDRPPRAWGRRPPAKRNIKGRPFILRFEVITEGVTRTCVRGVIYPHRKSCPSPEAERWARAAVWIFPVIPGLS